MAKTKVVGKTDNFQQFYKQLAAKEKFQRRWGWVGKLFARWAAA